MKQNLYLKILIFTMGMTLLGLGINMMITCSDFGLSPWDSLFLSLYQKFGLSIGTWMLISNTIMAIIVLINNKKDVNIGTFIMIALISMFVDGIGWLALDTLQQLPDIVAFILGNLSIGTGIGLYIATQLMVAPHESFMLLLTKKFNWSYRKAEIVGSIFAVLGSLLLSGPVFIGTAFLIFTTGYIIQFVMEHTQKVLKKLDENKKSLELQEV